MAAPTTSWVRKLELVDRIDHRDADGGGEIVRVLYCEPYTSYPAVLTALKGTVKLDGDAAGGQTWKRVPPHADPNVLRTSSNYSTDKVPYFFCTDAKVVPFAREAVRGAASKGYRPTNDTDDQLDHLRTSLDVPDDFDFAGGIDNLALDEIRKGAPDYSGDTERPCFTSRGECGALIVATYTPAVWLDNWPEGSARSPFDFLDPIWTPIVKHTQLGRNIKMYFGTGIFGTELFNRSDGINDTATVPEGMIELTFWRKLVPFLPRNAIARLTNRIAQSPLRLGNQQYPAGTVRIEPPRQVLRKVAPDGAIYYDIQLHFTIRVLRAEIWQYEVGFQDDQPVTWNHMLAIPKIAIPIVGGSIPAGRMSYYPVGFESGATVGMFGKWRPLYLTDLDFLGQFGGIDDLFSRGWTADDEDCTKNV